MDQTVSGKAEAGACAWPPVSGAQRKHSVLLAAGTLPRLRASENTGVRQEHGQRGHPVWRVRGGKGFQAVWLCHLDGPWAAGVKLAQRQTPLPGHEDPKGCGEGDGVLLFGDLVLFTFLKILF